MISPLLAALLLGQYHAEAPATVTRTTTVETFQVPAPVLVAPPVPVVVAVPREPRVVRFRSAGVAPLGVVPVFAAPPLAPLDADAVYAAPAPGRYKSKTVVRYRGR